MKLLALTLCLFSVYAHAGSESGGSIISLQQVQMALDTNHFFPQEVIVPGLWSADKFNVNRLMLSSNPARMSTSIELSPTVVNRINFVGSTDYSTILSINNDAFVVEVPNSEVTRSEEFMRAIESSVQTHDWSSIISQ